MAAEIPPNGAEQPIGEVGHAGTGIREDEGACAVGDLRHAFPQAGLAEEGGLLVTRDT
jgi:hypothetical protein